MQCSKNFQFIICRSIIECHLYEVDNDETGSVAISKKTEACIDCEAGDGQRCLPVHPGSEANLEKVKVSQGLQNVSQFDIRSHQIRLKATGFLHSASSHLDNVNDELFAKPKRSSLPKPDLEELPCCGFLYF